MRQFHTEDLLLIPLAFFGAMFVVIFLGALYADLSDKRDPNEVACEAKGGRWLYLKYEGHICVHKDALIDTRDP